MGRRLQLAEGLGRSMRLGYARRTARSPLGQMAFLPPSTRAFSKQFRPVAFIRILLVELVRRIFDPGAQLSYATAGEDLVLKKMLAQG